MREATSSKSCVLMRVSREGLSEVEVVISGGGFAQSGMAAIVDVSRAPIRFEGGREVLINLGSWNWEYEAVASRPA